MAPLERGAIVHAMERPRERHLHRLRPDGRHVGLPRVRQEHRHVHLRDDRLRNGFERGRLFRPVPQVLRLRRNGDSGQIEGTGCRLHRRRRLACRDFRGRGAAGSVARPDDRADGPFRQGSAEGHLRGNDGAGRAPHPHRVPQFLMVRPETGKGKAQTGRPRGHRHGLRGQGDRRPRRALAPGKA